MPSRPVQPVSDVTHALSFDIEDWFHMVEIEAVSDPARWPELPSIVVDRTKWIVDLVGEYGHTATFFMLGWVAERYPEITRCIHGAGHEIATHGYWHRKVYELDAEAFRADIQRSIDVLTDVTGEPVRGFRAPSFSITPGTEWAFDVLGEVGIEYDASLFPAPRGHGGYACPQEAHMVETPAGARMPELPMSIVRYGPAAVPFSGGGYMRFLPGALIRAGFRRFERKGVPVVIYLHPRDFDPDCPRVPMPLKRRFKCYVGMASTEGKLRSLLATRRFAPCIEVLQRAGLLPPAAGPSATEAAGADPGSGGMGERGVPIYSHARPEG